MFAVIIVANFNEEMDCYKVRERSTT